MLVPGRRRSSAREAFDRVAQRVGFAGAQRAWHRDCIRVVAADLAAPPYAIAPPRLGAVDQAILGVKDRAAHNVVVPQEGYAFGSYKPGTRNSYYEAAQTLREFLGPDHVSVVNVDPGPPTSSRTLSPIPAPSGVAGRGMWRGER